MKKKILIIIDSFGELDWIAPLVLRIQKGQNIDIKILFNCCDKNEILDKNKKIKSLIDSRDCLDHSIYYPILKILFIINSTYIKKVLNKLFSKLINFYPIYYSNKILRNYAPEILFHDIGTNTPFRDSLKKLVLKRGGDVIVFPHGSEVFVEEPPNFVDMNPNYLLCSSQSCSDVYQQNYPNSTSKVIGIPRLDDFWIRKMADTGNALTKSIDVFFITRGPHPSDLSPDSFSKIMNDVMSTISGLPNFNLHIKTHPRYSPKQIEEIASKYGNLNWKITDKSIIEMHKDIDLVISMWSSLIVDSITLGLPVIEFFLFEDSTHKWFEENGKKMTGYEKYNLVKNVNSKEELEAEIHYCLRNKEIVTEKSKKTLEYYLPKNRKESTNTILELIDEI